MIVVSFFYQTKDGEWKEGEKPFSCCYEAKRFILSLRRQGARFIDYDCDDPEDAEYLNR